MPLRFIGPRRGLELQGPKAPIKDTCTVDASMRGNSNKDNKNNNNKNNIC